MMLVLKRKFSPTRLMFASLGISFAYLIFKKRCIWCKEFSRDEDDFKDRHLTVIDKSGNQMHVRQLLNGKFDIRNSSFASPKNSLLTSADEHSYAKQITTYNISLQKNDQSDLIYPLFQSAEEMEFPTTNGKLPLYIKCTRTK
ncbi:uncharacterized protein LOC128548005 [Mercenaria mercenaria]|uniref:uncharacterized protein LOC128548005 n=1 Tax=Mercenaria mercenaria TaxID=6596 RepID=UPI00234E8865|nr:uncharacterized protein LOC128548005 [Mercenaria mercenaria]